MNDTLNFFRTDPSYRRQEYHKLTFSMAYFYNERYLLPLSHDEVVHGKATIIQKMAGDYDRFPQARALYLYMFLHPGKKLNFMGNEFAQFREWDEKRQQDFMLLKYPVHDAFHRYFRDLGALYLKYPALWQEDYVEDGFHWLSADDTEHVVYAFERRTMGQTILCVFNLSDQRQEFLYREEQGTASAGAGKTLGLQLLIDSDDEGYGESLSGGGSVNPSCLCYNGTSTGGIYLEYNTNSEKDPDTVLRGASGASALCSRTVFHEHICGG